MTVKILTIFLFCFGSYNLSTSRSVWQQEWSGFPKSLTGIQITCDKPRWFATFGGYLTSLEGVELGKSDLLEMTMKGTMILWWQWYKYMEIFFVAHNARRCIITYSVHSWPTSCSFLLFLEEKKHKSFDWLLTADLVFPLPPYFRLFKLLVSIQKIQQRHRGGICCQFKYLSSV